MTGGVGVLVRERGLRGRFAGLACWAAAPSWPKVALFYLFILLLSFSISVFYFMILEKANLFEMRDFKL
jgi:hypothetical protein